MFFGDRGQPEKFNNIRRNYDIIIDKEGETLRKMSNNLGFYNIIPLGRMNETEVVYDTDRNLLTGAGLLLRKKINSQRTYFTLIRVSSINSIQDREKKSFLGECEPKDQPSDFPEKIAEGINKIFNNLFTINLEDMVKHTTPYIEFQITGNKYKIVSGTGYEVEMGFETLLVRDYRTGKRAKVRNFSIEMDNNPNYEKERQEILSVIEHNCKELFFVNRNRFEIAEAAVKVPEIKEGEAKKKKKSKKELKKQENNEENAENS